MKKFILSSILLLFVSAVAHGFSLMESTPVDGQGGLSASNAEINAVKTSETEVIEVLEELPSPFSTVNIQEIRKQVFEELQKELDQQSESGEPIDSRFDQSGLRIGNSEDDRSKKNN